jgi:glycerophosphoryl diester phosphodiesterase
MSSRLRWLLTTVGVVLIAAALLLAFLPLSRTIDVQGHRGARGLLPENTLPAFALAQDLGVTTLELDTKVTADGVLVITHDTRLNPDLARDPAGEWVDEPTPAVVDLALAELDTYDVGRLEPGTDYALRFPDQQPVDGTRIPALSALFDQVAASGDTDVRFNIETKLEPDAPELSPTPAEFARLLVDDVGDSGLTDRVSIQSFDWRTLAEVQRIAPEITTVALTEADTDLLDGSWTAGLRLADYDGSVPRLVAASGADVWSPDFTQLTTETVAEAHELGLLVVPWTVNEPADIEGVLGMGVDGIISDYPDRAVDLVASSGDAATYRALAGILASVGGLLVLLVVVGRRRPPSTSPAA